MDFEELLNEVEGAIQGTATTAKQPQRDGRPVPSHSSYRPRQQKNELDDLLDMVADDERDLSRRPTPVHPRDATTSARREPYVAGGTKKCSQLLLAGEASKRGLNTAFSAGTACSNLRCNECDFTVVQFFGTKWSASADYMFFRENVPNEAKLRAKMEASPGSSAYACQCKWLSVDSASHVDSSRVKWSCAGH